MSEHYDVVQIGFGPVGQTFAALLGQSGHRVGAFERSPECYPLPRAGHVDHEIMRIFQSISAAASENGAVAMYGDFIDSLSWPDGATSRAPAQPRHARGAA